MGLGGVFGEYSSGLVQSLYDVVSLWGFFNATQTILALFVVSLRVRYIIISIFVDNIIITEDDASGIVQVKHGLRMSLDIKDLGPLRTFLVLRLLSLVKAYLYLSERILLTFFRIHVCLSVDLPLHLWSQILGC